LDNGARTLAMKQVHVATQPQAGWRATYGTALAARFASMRSQIIASMLMPSKRSISWMPVGEVTLRAAPGLS
jgi:hypothetical protein